METRIFRLDNTVSHDAAIDAWFIANGELGAVARRWFGVMRQCGDEVREVMHDGCPTACFCDAAFGYVSVHKAHVNVGFFQGSALRDPARLLEGSGKWMRHVKLRTGMAVNEAALEKLIAQAYEDIRGLVERG